MDMTGLADELASMTVQTVHPVNGFAKLAGLRHVSLHRAGARNLVHWIMQQTTFALESINLVEEDYEDSLRFIRLVEEGCRVIAL
jgi:hypothetical protein